MIEALGFDLEACVYLVVLFFESPVESFTYLVASNIAIGNFLSNDGYLPAICTIDHCVVLCLDFVLSTILCVTCLMLQCFFPISAILLNLPFS